MKILLTGSTGQLGQALMSILTLYQEVVAPGRKELDLTDPAAILKYIMDVNPDIIIHCAAITDVDLCELNSGEAFRVNTCGTYNLVRTASYSKTVFCYISTNFVFNGLSSRPYLDNDAPDPVNVYGLSKLMAEDYIRNMLQSYFIIRTSWLYGGPNNFVDRIIKKASQQEELLVTTDQYASPTYVRDLAAALQVLLQSNNFGTYHLCNQGYCSRYQWVEQILLYTGIKTRLEGVDSAYFSSAARRPSFAVLESSKYRNITGLELRNWKEGLYSYLMR